ncbi:MAG: class I SAM-dependent methyltransferase [Chloroflexi bacterium]|nr:class I SAM-dependent methyltransferase [Chloroflexota bacterium]
MTVTHEPHHHAVESDAHRPENWNDEDFVAEWLARQPSRPDRPRQFAIIRALVPKLPEQEFRYINLGAGPGMLDEVLLRHFPSAQATLVDLSLQLLAAARQRLAPFGDRVEYVQANLGTSDWSGAVSGPFDFAFSTLAVHNFGDARRIREVYAETYRLLGHGGTLFNLDYVRPSRPSLAPLAAWAARDPDAGLSGRGGGNNMPGSLLEHLGWLSEAGFNGVEVLWKDMNTAVVCGIRDHLHMPEGYGAEAAHGHAAPHAH